jgi:hypothetical protein
MVGQKFFKDSGSNVGWGTDAFFPAPETGESNVEIMFPEDGYGLR